MLLPIVIIPSSFAGSLPCFFYFFQVLMTSSSILQPTYRGAAATRTHAFQAVYPTLEQGLRTLVGVYQRRGEEMNHAPALPVGTIFAPLLAVGEALSPTASDNARRRHQQVNAWRSAHAPIDETFLKEMQSLRATIVTPEHETDDIRLRGDHLLWIAAALTDRVLQPEDLYNIRPEERATLIDLSDCLRPLNKHLHAEEPAHALRNRVLVEHGATHEEHAVKPLAERDPTLLAIIEALDFVDRQGIILTLQARDAARAHDPAQPSAADYLLRLRDTLLPQWANVENWDQARALPHQPRLPQDFDDDAPLRRESNGLKTRRERGEPGKQRWRPRRILESDSAKAVQCLVSVCETLYSERRNQPPMKDGALNIPNYRAMVILRNCMRDASAAINLSSVHPMPSFRATEVLHAWAEEHLHHARITHGTRSL